jgi:hypothetical protein
MANDQMEGVFAKADWFGIGFQDIIVDKTKIVLYRADRNWFW